MSFICDNYYYCELLQRDSTFEFVTFGIDVQLASGHKSTMIKRYEDVYNKFCGMPFHLKK